MEIQGEKERKKKGSTVRLTRTKENFREQRKHPGRGDYLERIKKKRYRKSLRSGKKRLKG